MEVSLAHQPLHIIAYDISDNRARRAVAARLEKIGLRVQGSVFEVRATQRRIEMLLESIRPQISPGDSLRAYPIPDRSAARTRVLGSGAPPPVGGHWIL